ncbi:MAG: HEAT repeat domain-containing protein, partial [Promethearchaeota archaeon]
LHHESRDMRVAVACHLGRIGDERAIEQLVVASKDEDERVRGAATKALEKIRGDTESEQS